MRFARKLVGYTRPVRLHWTVLLFGLLASVSVAHEFQSLLNTN